MLWLRANKLVILNPTCPSSFAEVECLADRIKQWFALHKRAPHKRF